MAAMTDYLEGELRKHIFRTASFTKPTVLAVALFTSAPSDAGGGTEVSGGSYARATLNPSDANWNADGSDAGHVSNAAAIIFPAPTGNWGTVTHFGIFDAEALGNMLFHGALDDPRTINSGDAAPQYDVDELDVTFA